MTARTGMPQHSSGSSRNSGGRLDGEEVADKGVRSALSKVATVTETAGLALHDAQNFSR
jgi:hypothetical protein